jgi:two-component system, chemotaxis family, sensor kinase Cph1
MDEIIDFFSRLFDTSSWPPRWHCGEWTDFHGWLYIASDLAIWAAYFTIPFLLAFFVRKRRDVPFQSVFLLFGLFIFACGATHLIDAIIFWVPIYRVSALVRFLTAVVSWATIVGLAKVLPQAMLLRSPAELDRVVAQRTKELEAANERLKEQADTIQRAYDDLEIKVTFRTLELEKQLRELRGQQG